LDEPDDEYWEDQWNLKDDNYGIGCPTAWDVTPGSTSVKLAIIDTGVDYNHPDL
jgi:thermitase